MDNSRDHDLIALHKRFNDFSLPKLTRTRAWRSFNKILAQVRDKKLVEMRHRLVRAKLANDSDAADKIELQIEDYTKDRHY